uniref:uncharacterized protein LOC128929554 n=1 Tax=Callithrix jacchus TaxID=9483 RepID=UPI0023DD47D3|nr:uncharacterized protein LOC128929554 [Callithrix jacchus]
MSRSSWRVTAGTCVEPTALLDLSALSSSQQCAVCLVVFTGPWNLCSSTSCEKELELVCARVRAHAGEKPRRLQRSLGPHHPLSVPICKGEHIMEQHPSTLAPRLQGYATVWATWLRPRPPSQASLEAEAAKPTTEPGSLGHRSQRLI